MANPSNLQSQTDREILNLLSMEDSRRRKGEELFFSQFLYFIREGARKYHLSEEDAVDAYSEAVLSALSNITSGAFQGNSSLKTFLYSIFRNKCVDLLRKRTTKKDSIHHTLSVGDWIPELSDTSKSILQQLVDKTDFRLLHKRLHDLGEKCRQLLILSADGNTDKDIMKELDYKTTDVVKTSRLRCLDRLRLLYKQTI